MSKYVVLPVSEITPLIIANLKNYVDDDSVLFVEDTLDSIMTAKITRIDNGVDYVILKVKDATGTPEIQAVLPDHNGGADPFYRIYGNKNAMRVFLQNNFEELAL